MIQFYLQTFCFICFNLPLSRYNYLRIEFGSKRDKEYFKVINTYFIRVSFSVRSYGQSRDDAISFRLKDHTSDHLVIYVNCGLLIESEVTLE